MRGVRCPVLVGREDELGQLTDLLARAANGSGGAAFLLGEAGIGKSRLLATVADIARSRDMAVLRGRAAPSPAPVPYRPVAEAFLSAVRARDVDLGGLERFGSALPVLLPGWQPSGGDPDPSLVLLGEAAIALAQRCAGAGGVIVVLEDLHWADAETCQLLDYLSDKLDGARIAVVASVRTGESSEAERLAHTLTGRRLAESLVLRRLDAGQVDALIGASLGTAAVPEELRAAVAGASGGVPLLAEEFLASLIDAEAVWREQHGWRVAPRLPALVPPSFGVLVADRLARLGPTAQCVLGAAAVVGDQIDPRLVSSITGVDEAAAVDVLRDAARAQLVDEAPAGAQAAFRFRHGLSRAAVLDRLSEAERRRLARAALDALDHGDAGIHAGPDLLAALALTAGDTDRAARDLLDAAAVASRRGACRSARHAAEQALALAGSRAHRAAAREVLLDAAVEAGDVAGALDVSGPLLGDLAQLGADPPRVARVHLRLARAAVPAARWEDAERHLRDAAAAPAVDADAELLVEADLLRTAIALGRHDPEAAAAHAGRAIVAAGEAGARPQLAEAGMLLGRAYRALDIDAARRAFAEALDAARRSGSRVLVARATHELATLDVIEAGPTGLLEEARRLADEAGALALVAACDAHLAILHWLHFDLDASRARWERALEAATRYQLGLLVPMAAVALSATDAVRGHAAGVHEAFERHRMMMDGESEATSRGHVLATFALAVEDRDGALDELERAARLVPAYSDVARAPHAGLRALLIAVTGRHGGEAAVAALLDDRAVAGVARALAQMALGVQQGRAGDAAGAEDAVDRGAAGLAAAPWFRAIALRHAAEAAIEDGWGRPAGWLRDAHDFFDGAGTEAPAAACRELLRRAGAPPPRRPARGQHPQLARLGVTAREAEVLHLVAEGLSNREVADRLVLSVRTVEKHVERLMTKTSTANRTQLAALAARLAGSRPPAT